MRIFIGFSDVAGIASVYSRAFQALGHETLTIMRKRNPYYPEAVYDFVLGEPRQKGVGVIPWLFSLPKREIAVARLLPYVIERCDVFIFIGAESFFPGNLDFQAIKRAGKKIIATFWGSDIRYWRALRADMEALGVKEEIAPFLEVIQKDPNYRIPYFIKKRTVNSAERFADLILSQPGYGQLQSRPYMRANVPIDQSLFRFHIPDREKPLVLHVPSYRGTKGTDFILHQVEELKNKGLQFDFQLVENVPNQHVRKLLSEADIVVDELYSETVGMLSTEAMASGTVTLVRYMPDYAGVPKDCPAVNVTRNTLALHLEMVITDRALRKRLARAGRLFIENHNDYLKIAGDMLTWLKPGGIKQYDFVPIAHK